jgi:hypothetical protein
LLSEIHRLNPRSNHQRPVQQCAGRFVCANDARPGVDDPHFHSAGHEEAPRGGSAGLENGRTFVAFQRFSEQSLARSGPEL